MPIVRVQVSEADLECLTRRGLDPQALLRAALRHEIERIEVEEDQARLDQKRIRISRPAEDLIREDRDRH